MKKNNYINIIKGILFPLFILVLLGLAWITRGEWIPVLSEPESIRQMVLNQGYWGPLVFVGLQVIQVVVFVIPGEVTQLAAGYIYGPFWGLTYSIAGILIGSAFNFYAARIMGSNFVRLILSQKALNRFDGVISSPKAIAGFFLFFLIPGVPKDALCYMSGLSRISFWAFMLISGVARLPGILGSTIMGASLAHRRWSVALGLLGAAVVISILTMVFRKPLHYWIHRISNSSRGYSRED